MLIADDDQRDHADLTETAKRKKSWEDANYNIISMKNDFKTIYGEGVEIRKVMLNNVLYIIRDGKIYNVQGQLVK